MTEPLISSPSNPRLKAASRLRGRRERDETGLTLVDGARELTRAIDAGVAVEEVFIAPQLVRSDDADRVVRVMEQRGVRRTPLSGAAFAKLAYGDRSDGVIGIVRTPPTTLDRLELPPDPLVVVLEGVEKPGNVGAVLRSVDGAGADALIVADPRTDLFNPNTIRASLGTVFSVRTAASETIKIRAWLDMRGLRAVAALVDAAQPPWDADLTGPLALVLGSEAHGLGHAWGDDRVTRVRIPMLGHADSLNVSVAAAVMLYEARRQRG